MAGTLKIRDQDVVVVEVDQDQARPPGFNPGPGEVERLTTHDQLGARTYAKTYLLNGRSQTLMDCPLYLGRRVASKGGPAHRRDRLSPSLAVS